MDDTNACIITELTQGMELAKQLKAVLSSECSPVSKQVLIQEIISSYDRALLIVNWGGGGGGGGDSGGQPPALAPPPESSVSIDESPQSGDLYQQFDNQQDQKVVCKKRKAMPTWRNQVRISTDNGLEGNTDDGYSWRKYGQKDILGAKFPRSYYRCTYRYVHNCMARKQVQRTDEDPTVFEITYRGKHTCNPATARSVPPPPPSPEKHDTKYHNHHHHQLPPPPKPTDMLSNLRENLRVSTSDLDATVPCSFSFPSTSLGYTENYQQQFHFSNETENGFLQGYSQSFVSPATSGSNYFTEWGNEFPNHDDSNLSGMISTTASATTSPLAFPTDQQDFSPSFPFNNSGFFI